MVLREISLFQGLYSGTHSDCFRTTLVTQKLDTKSASLIVGFGLIDAVLNLLNLLGVLSETFDLAVRKIMELQSKFTAV